MNPLALLSRVYEVLSSVVVHPKYGKDRPPIFRTNLSLLILFLASPAISFSQTDSVFISDSSKKMITTRLLTRPLNPQVLPPSEYLNKEEKKKRQWFIAGINIAGYGGSLILLNSTWYKGYARTGFQTFNDSKEWLQMDKIGHGWGSL